MNWIKFEDKFPDPEKPVLMFPKNGSFWAVSIGESDQKGNFITYHPDSSKGLYLSKENTLSIYTHWTYLEKPADTQLDLRNQDFYSHFKESK